MKEARHRRPPSAYRKCLQEANPLRPRWVTVRAREAGKDWEMGVVANVHGISFWGGDCSTLWTYLKRSGILYCWYSFISSFLISISIQLLLKIWKGYFIKDYILSLFSLLDFGVQEIYKYSTMLYISLYDSLWIVNVLG